MQQVKNALKQLVARLGIQRCARLAIIPVVMKDTGLHIQKIRPFRFLHRSNENHVGRKSLPSASGISPIHDAKPPHVPASHELGNHLMTHVHPRAAFIDAVNEKWSASELLECVRSSVVLHDYLLLTHKRNGRHSRQHIR